MRKSRKLGGWILMALVLLAYGATAVVDPGVSRQAWSAFRGMLGSIAPVLMLVFGLMFLTERFLTPARTHAWLGRGSGLRGWALALAACIVSTGPVYSWYALLAGLREKGMRPALVAVFAVVTGVLTERLVRSRDPE